MSAEPVLAALLAVSLVVFSCGFTLLAVVRPVPLMAAFMGCVLLLEQFPIKLESWTVQPAFYDNFNTSLGISALKFNPIEVVMALLLLALIVRKLARPDETFRILTVSLLGLAYGGWMLFAVGWGLVNHGNWKVALWILRPVVYFLGMGFLAFQLIRTRRQVAWCAVIFAVAVTWKSLQLILRWANPGIDLTGQVLEAYGSHEDTSFALAVAWMALIGCFARFPRGLQRFLWMIFPVVLLAIVVNERRINYATFVVGSVFILFMQHRDDLRRRMLPLLLLAAFGLLYFVAGWFGPDIGPFGPIKGIKEGVRAELIGDNTDASSWYRKVERFNLLHTVRSSPLLGTGLGVQYLQIIPLDKLSFGYAVYITHNQILLVHSATGSVGYFLFLLFYCALIAQLAIYVRELREPWERAIAQVALLSIMNWLIVGYYDMQLFFFRNSLVAGFLIALPAVLHRIQCLESRPAAAAPPQQPLRRLYHALY